MADFSNDNPPGTQTLPAEISIHIFRQLDLAHDWQALIACWNVQELRGYIRSAFVSPTIVAYKYPGNKFVELGIVLRSKSPNGMYLLDLVSNTIKTSCPRPCHVLNSSLLGKLSLNNVNCLSTKSLATLWEFLIDERYISMLHRESPEIPGETVLLFNNSRTPECVGIQIVSVNNGEVAIEVPSRRFAAFRRLNILRLYNEHCRAYHIWPFTEITLSLDAVLNAWTSRNQEFVERSQRQHGFRQTKRTMPDSKYTTIKRRRIKGPEEGKL